MKKISPRDKKFLTAGAVAVCLFVLLKFLVLPFFDERGQVKEDLAFKVQTLKKYEGYLKEHSALEQKLKALSKEDRKTNRSLLKGETPSLAAADLQKIVDKIAGKSKVSIKSVKVMDPGEDEDFMTIPVRVQFEGDLTKMTKFVEFIETEGKLLTIPELKIRVKNKRRPAEIAVTCVVVGFMKQEETET